MKNALIVGAGSGLSASIARRFSSEGMNIALVARNVKKLRDISEEISAKALQCDVTTPEDVEHLFEQLVACGQIPDLVVYNAGVYSRGPIVDLDIEAARNSLLVNAFGAMLVAREAAKYMLKKGGGTMLFTGASAGIKGYAESAPFAMGKFALRGLCQSLARELSPKNIHVAHFIIDGMILQPGRGEPYDNPNRTLDPNDIANTYWSIAKQNRSAWTWEVELRPYNESF